MGGVVWTGREIGPGRDLRRHQPEPHRDRSDHPGFSMIQDFLRGDQPVVQRDAHHL